MYVFFGTEAQRRRFLDDHRRQIGSQRVVLASMAGQELLGVTEPIAIVIAGDYQPCSGDGALHDMIAELNRRND